MLRTQTLAETFQQVKQLMEAGGDLMMSFFSLTKTNNGKFKSEAQAKLLSSKLDANQQFVSVQSLSFGNTKNAQQSVTWTVTCDAEGVTKIEKQTKTKGTELYWVPKGTQGAENTLAAKKEVNAAKAVNSTHDTIRQTMATWQERLAAIEAELSKVQTVRQMPQFADLQSMFDESERKLQDEKAQLTSAMAQNQAILDK